MPNILLSVKKEFTAADVVDEKLVKWIQAIPLRSWKHPLYGDETVDKTRGENFVRSFHDKVRGQELLLNYEHGTDAAKGSKASGKVLDVQLREDGVYYYVEFTPDATKEILNGEWNYFSPEYYDSWKDPVTQADHTDVIVGGALTNNPFHKDMAPLNFSEVFAEVAELEHSEPGSGTPPIPRETPEEDDAKEGWRRDTPPDSITPEDSMNEKVLEALGLPKDATPEQISAAVLAMATENKTFSELKRVTEQKKTFAEQFPEQAAQMERDKAFRTEQEAKNFSEQYRQFSIVEKNAEGNDVVKQLNKGFSAVVVDKIAETHKAFAEGNATLDTLKDLMSTVASDSAVVMYGEIGSGRTNDATEDTGDINKDMHLFAEKLSEIQTRDKCSWEVAFATAQTEHPQLAKSYAERIGRK